MSLNYRKSKSPSIQHYSSSGTFITREDVTNGTNFAMNTIVFDHQNTIELAEWNKDERFKLTGHEFGHALSFNHFEDSAFLQPAHTGGHCMQSGKFAITSPTSTDADHLANKYPN